MDKGLRINTDKRRRENGYGKNGCGPKKEPVEPASELLVPHLLCIHVILKTQLRTPKLQTVTIKSMVAGRVSQMAKPFTQ